MIHVLAIITAKPGQRSAVAESQRLYASASFCVRSQRSERPALRHAAVRCFKR